jgi:U3 small nucleolar RNA-associated protein 23
MRLLRHKRNRKTLEFFRLSFKVFPPYKVLLDGNFIAQAVKMQLGSSFERLLQQLLADKTFLHVTDCVLEELIALGEPAKHTLAAARTISVIRCRHKHGHKPGMDPAQCLAALVGPANASHYFVATQDAELRGSLRAIPGTPLLLFSKNVLVLEQASGASKGEHRAAESAKAGLSADEAAAVRAAKKALREGVGGTRTAGPPPPLPLAVAPAAASAPMGGREPATATATSAAAAAASGRSSVGLGSGGGAAAAAAAGVKRRRKSGGPSGPNPLSVKKKQRQQQQQLPALAPGGATIAAAAAPPAGDAPHSPSGGDHREGGGASGVRRRRKGAASRGTAAHLDAPAAGGRAGGGAGEGGSEFAV